MWEDPIVKEVRQVRDELERQFNFDTKAIFADLRKRQVSLDSRLVRRQRETEIEQATAPDRDSVTLHPGR